MCSSYEYCARAITLPDMASARQGVFASVFCSMIVAYAETVCTYAGQGGRGGEGGVGRQEDGAGGKGEGRGKGSVGRGERLRAAEGWTDRQTDGRTRNIRRDERTASGTENVRTYVRT